MKWFGLVFIFLMTFNGNNAAGAIVYKVSSTYQNVYQDIINTVVTIDDFILRTDQGRKIKIETELMTVDLQSLSSNSQGLWLPIRGSNLPRKPFYIVEIEAKISWWRPAYVNFANGGQCRLRVPESLYFYASQPIAVEKDLYLVKAEFLPMDSIQGEFDPESSTLDHCALVNSRRPILEMKRMVAGRTR